MKDSDFDKLNQQLVRLIMKGKDIRGVRKLGYSYVDIVSQIDFLKKHIKKSHLQNKFVIMDTGKRIRKSGKFDIFLP